MAQQSVVAEFRDAYYSELDAGEQSALIAWLAFTGAWSGVRGITHAIRAGKGPFRNMSLGGEHLHHYMWGIGMLAGVGGVAVRGDEKLHRHPATAVTYGVGLALIVDEFALLLDLQDVYWAKQGRISVDVAIGGIAAAGSVFAALPVLRKVARRLRERGKETESQPAAHSRAHIGRNRPVLCPFCPSSSVPFAPYVGAGRPSAARPRLSIAQSTCAIGGDCAIGVAPSRARDGGKRSRRWGAFHGCDCAGWQGDRDTSGYRYWRGWRGPIDGPGRIVRDLRGGNQFKTAGVIDLAGF